MYTGLDYVIMTFLATMEEKKKNGNLGSWA